MNILKKTLSTYLIFISTSLFAASFNCDIHDELTPIKLTPVENMICSEPQLSEADEKMSLGYFTLLGKLLDLDTRKLFIKDQREWLLKRNIELSTCSKPNCEIKFYNFRVKLLYPSADINCKIPEPEVNSEIALEPIESKDISIKSVDNEVLKLESGFETKNSFKPKDISSKSATEIICANRLLRHVDGKVLELYTPLAKELSKDQAAWIILRDEKLRNCDLMCVWKFYKERIEFLIHYNFDESYIDILEK